ncbi:uncharacterized protein LOC110251051 [Exaiptasia diaphana]|uniref:Uncharacterized protein n=1 Tax=Exaiptasia diaphana TaxID=2652724 RepID=A0A913Y0X3_EXADI|nr:uncharacterized protein LOC110251051 [Exaiptasia diaphana]KXJ23188.1 hypothetical protein AC249_AIPGENE3884 [Exaiptasia diaphana]
MARLREKLSVLLAIMMMTMMLKTTGVECGSNLLWKKASNGGLPDYPVAGGSDYPGEVLYVARIRLGSDQTPGKMDVSNRKAHASWGGREHSDTQYEILTNPGWRSHLEWQASGGYQAPANAVLGGYDNGRPVYVARVRYPDGHMIPGKAAFFYGKAYVGYGGKEYESTKFDVLVEHQSKKRKRDVSSRFDYPNLPNVKPLKRAPIIAQ